MTRQSLPTAENAANLFSRSLDSTLNFVRSVPADRWHSPSPCDEWDVSQVVNHLVYENLWAAELFTGKTMEEVGGDAFQGDLVGDDPIKAYEETVPGVKAVIFAPGAMTGTCHLSFGDAPGYEYAIQLFQDTLIHGWDVAKGSGQDTTLDASLVEACFPIAQLTREQFADSGAFGDKLETPPGAGLQSRMLALLGREA